MTLNMKLVARLVEKVGEKENVLGEKRTYFKQIQANVSIPFNFVFPSWRQGGRGSWPNGRPARVSGG